MLLNVSDVKKHYSDQIILDGVQFRIDRGERVGLVGRNGCGKSTLLKIIVGELTPDSGSVQLAKSARISYLKQDSKIKEGVTVLSEAQEGLKNLFEIRERLNELEITMKTSSSLEILDEYAMLQAHFEEKDGFAIERDVQTVLNMLGFDESQFSLLTDDLSGGQRTRLALAKLLLEEPELLLLDEPTNHLDMDATEFLENWLKQYRSSSLIVSHDRRFLESVATRIIEMQEGKVKTYPGNYQQYLRLRAEDEERQRTVFAKQQAQIEKLDEYVRRFMNSQRTAQARGRLKMKNRLVEQRVTVSKDSRGLNATIEQGKRSGQDVVIVKKATLGYPNKKLIENLNWSVQYQERWGVIGENGAGKSTLAKTLISNLTPLEGSVRLGANVQYGYFSQDSEDFDFDQSPLDFLVWECNLSPIDARHWLGRFLIEGDDAFRPIKSLSGGERNKLSLAHLSILKPNLLILDEPTNHLDIASREALAEMLREYSGTLILISHDRWLLSEVTDHILDLKKNRTTQFQGSYDEYRVWLGNQAEKSAPKKSQKGAKSPEPPAEESLTPREISKEIQRLEVQIMSVENEIANEEEKIKALEEKLAHLPESVDIVELTSQYSAGKKNLENLMHNWEETHIKIDDLKAMQGKSASLIG